jgi:hypothetical protein
MEDTSGIRPPSDSFAFWVAQRQYEEQRRRAALFAGSGADGRSLSTYESLHGPAPFTGIASAQILHAAPSPNQTAPGSSSLLQRADDVTPLQLSKQTPPGARMGPPFAGPSVGGEGLLNTAEGPDLAIPVIAGAMALGLPEDLPLIPLVLLALAILNGSQGKDQSGSPRFGGSTKLGGAVGRHSTPIAPPLPGFPGTPFPIPSLPPSTSPQSTEKPVFENIPPKIDLSLPPFPVIDDDRVEARIKAGSKTPWADAYPELDDWLKNTILKNSNGNDDTKEDNEKIIEILVDGYRKSNVTNRHTHGGSRPEKYYGDPSPGVWAVVGQMDHLWWDLSLTLANLNVVSGCAGYGTSGRSRRSLERSRS